MSDHVDGPRQIGDPAGDLTDLFAFANPSDPSRTVLVADVFPSAGASAFFSNAVEHAIVVRHASIAGVGDAAQFETGTEEYRFSCRFDALADSGGTPVQRGSCTLPGGASLPITVNDEKGTASSDGAFRIFAGLRSDPFLLAWANGKPSPNLLQHDNVLSIVIDFETRKALDLTKGSLFGVAAETVPMPQPGSLASFIGGAAARLDWVGRPEQTNQRLDNSGLKGAVDLRDLWNQQKPFALAEELRPMFRKRLQDSLSEWDSRDGKADWTPAGIAANANVFLDDYMLFDVAKPFSNSSFLEIEKSTLNGKPYQTGGGRTVDSNVIDILQNWLINRDQGTPLVGGATAPTKLGTTTFPYLAAPNAEIQTVVNSVDLAANPAAVWKVIGQFGGMWHPLVAQIRLTGSGIGQLRSIETVDGQRLIERLEALDETQRFYRYTMISGIPADPYTGTLDVKAHGGGCSVEWRVNYLADGQPNIIIKTIVSSLLKTGLASLKQRFGSAA